MPSRFSSPIYSVTLASGAKVQIDVTNSISAGLEPNSGLLASLIPWMKERGYSRVLDFGAGALRHTLPLLNAGFEVVAVEYQEAYQRRKAAEARAIAERHDGFTALVWPQDFLNSRVRCDVALLLYVLQVIPVKVERKIVLESIAKHLDRNGPKRLFYASRYGESNSLPNDIRYNDGWVRGKAEHDRSFYTEWNTSDTNDFFSDQGYTRAGRYEGASQGFIFDFKPGLLG